MKTEWPLVRFGEVMRQRRPDVTVDPAGIYQFAGVYCFGRGVFRGQQRGGSEFAYSTLNRLRAGEFVYPKLMAWEGAFGVVPSNCDGCYVSPEFPVFEIDSQRLDARFLAFYFQIPRVWEAISGGSTGTNVRRRRLNPADFVRHEMPLPPLAEQRRIVARVEGLAAQVQKTRILREQAANESEALIVSTRRSLIGERPSASWIPLKRFVRSIENGKSPQCESRPANSDEWAVLKVGAISFGTFDERENKALPVGLDFDPRHEVRLGDFLMSRANTTELVGACAIVGHTRPRLLLSDKTFRFHFRTDGEVEPRWLDHAMKSPALREQIERGASGTSPTMKNISKEKVTELLLPPHSLSQQRRIIAEMDALQAQVAALQRLQAETAVELDALLSAILDRAFKGEL